MKNKKTTSTQGLKHLGACNFIRNYIINRGKEGH